MRLAALGWLLIAGCALAEEAPISIRVTDLSERFLNFYQAAGRPEINEAARWALWKKEYGFAAVAPDAEGEIEARSLLSQAWPRYPALIDRIIAGYPGMRPAPEMQLKRIAALLKLDRPLRLHLIAYVGMTEGNAFTTVDKDEVQVALPIEDPPEHRAVTAAHELTHAVHLALGTLDGPTVTLAQIVLTEGLAMHVSRILTPGGRTETYVEYSPGWFRKATNSEQQILRGIRNALPSADVATLLRFTEGRGSAGLEHEAYFAGWKLVERLLQQGWTPDRLARVRPSAMPALLDSAIEQGLTPIAPTR